MAGMHSPLHLPVGRSSDFIMHIYSCDHWVIKGSVSHVQSGRSMAFRSLMEMVLAVQAKMDEIGFPQSSTAPRNWRSRTEQIDTYANNYEMGAAQPEDVMPESIQASFLIRIQFRQNASWQGTLVWMDSKESCSFRSLLELITLIANAMHICQAQTMDSEASLAAKSQTTRNNVSGPI